MSEEITPALLAYNVEDAAAQLDKLGAGTIRGLIKKGELGVVKVGIHDRIPHFELERFLRERMEYRNTE